MDRRQFMCICGCVGVGSMIGLGAAETGRAVDIRGQRTANTRKAAWMYGSAKAGCARLPDAALLKTEPDLVNPAPFR